MLRWIVGLSWPVALSWGRIMYKLKAVHSGWYHSLAILNYMWGEKELITNPFSLFLTVNDCDQFFQGGWCQTLWPWWTVAWKCVLSKPFLSSVDLVMVFLSCIVLWKETKTPAEASCYPCSYLKWFQGSWPWISIKLVINSYLCLTMSVVISSALYFQYLSQIKMVICKERNTVNILNFLCYYLSAF